MQNVPVTLVLAATLTVYLTLDTAVILQTGKTPGLFYKFLRYRQRYGPITRKKPPVTLLVLHIWKRDRFGAVYSVRRLGFIFAENLERCDSLVSGFMLSTRRRITHNDKDVSAPIDLTGRPTAALIPNADLKVYEGAPHGLLLGAHEVVELDGAKLFFPRERSIELAAALGNFWD